MNKLILFLISVAGLPLANSWAMENNLRQTQGTILVNPSITYGACKYSLYEVNPTQPGTTPNPNACFADPCEVINTYQGGFFVAYSSSEISACKYNIYKIEITMSNPLSPLFPSIQTLTLNNPTVVGNNVSATQSTGISVCNGYFWADSSGKISYVNQGIVVGAPCQP